MTSTISADTIARCRKEFARTLEKHVTALKTYLKKPSVAILDGVTSSHSALCKALVAYAIVRPTETKPEMINAWGTLASCQNSLEHARHDFTAAVNEDRVSSERTVAARAEAAKALSASIQSIEKAMKRLKI